MAALHDITNSPGKASLSSPVKGRAEAPPPPPPEDELAIFENEVARIDEAPSTDATPAAASAPSVGFLSQRQFKVLFCGNALFGALAVSGSSATNAAAWLALGLLLFNGIATTFRAPKAHTPPNAADVAGLLPLVTSAIRLYERVVEGGEPRLTFIAALGAFALTVISSFVPDFVLGWFAFNAAVLLPAARTRGLPTEVGAAIGAVRDSAVKMCDASALDAHCDTFYQLLEAKVSPKIAQYSHLFPRPNRGWAVLSLTFGWVLILGWTQKLLVGAFAILAYKAWASPEDNAKLSQTVKSGMEYMPIETATQGIAQIKKSARRMTMGAGERLAGFTTHINKPKEL